jgi:hypothetical protein
VGGAQASACFSVPQVLPVCSQVWETFWISGCFWGPGFVTQSWLASVTTARGLSLA